MKVYGIKDGEEIGKIMSVKNKAGCFERCCILMCCHATAFEFRDKNKRLFALASKEVCEPTCCTNYCLQDFIRV